MSKNFTREQRIWEERSQQSWCCSKQTLSHLRVLYVAKGLGSGNAGGATTKVSEPWMLLLAFRFIRILAFALVGFAHLMVFVYPVTSSSYSRCCCYLLLDPVSSCMLWVHLHLVGLKLQQQQKNNNSDEMRWGSESEKEEKNACLDCLSSSENWKSLSPQQMLQRQEHQGQPYVHSFHLSSPHCEVHSDAPTSAPLDRYPVCSLRILGHSRRRRRHIQAELRKARAADLGSPRPGTHSPSSVHSRSQPEEEELRNLRNLLRPHNVPLCALHDALHDAPHGLLGALLCSRDGDDDAPSSSDRSHCKKQNKTKWNLLSQTENEVFQKRGGN